MGPGPSAEAPRAGHALAPAKEQSLSNPRSNSRGTLHLFSCLLWVSPQLSQLALALFQLTLGPNSSSNYFPLASPNPCHSTILGRGRRIGRWSLDLVGVAKKEWGGSPLRLVISAPERASKFHSLRLLWPPSLPELQLAQHSGGGTHRGLVHLKGWERPKAHFSCRVFRQLVPKFQEHPPLFNHGLCEYGDPPPTLRPRDGLGAQPGRARVDQDLGSSSRGAALNKCLFWASVAVSVK